MALGTVTEVKKGVVGDLKYAILDVAVSASYTTGGEAFDFAQVPSLAREILMVDAAGATSGKTAVWDTVNKKLMSFTAGVQTTAATNLSGASEIVRLIVYGK